MEVFKSSQQEIRSMPRFETADEADDKAVFQIRVFPRAKAAIRHQPASIYAVGQDFYLRRVHARFREVTRQRFGNCNHEIGPSPHETLDPARQRGAHHSAAIALLFVDQRRVHLEDKWQTTTFGGVKTGQSPQAVALVNEVWGETPHSRCSSSEEPRIV